MACITLLMATISPHDLPAEIIVRIACAAHTGSALDLNTLQSLSLTCKWIQRALAAHREAIIEHYIVTVELDEEVNHYLYGELHSVNDAPACLMYMRMDKMSECMHNPRYSWFHHGKLHRGGDKPAVVWFKGAHWYRDGQLYRDDGELATIHDEGRILHWYRHGKLHREGDLPANICNDGTTAWYRDGQLHRDGDKPAVVHPPGPSVGDPLLVTAPDGLQEWYQEGQRHREGDKPTIIWGDGRMEWFHRGHITAIMISPRPVARCVEHAISSIPTA